MRGSIGRSGVVVRVEVLVLVVELLVHRVERLALAEDLVVQAGD